MQQEPEKCSSFYQLYRHSGNGIIKPKGMQQKFLCQTTQWGGGKPPGPPTRMMGVHRLALRTENVLCLFLLVVAQLIEAIVLIDP